MDQDVRQELLKRIDQRQGRTPLFLYIVGLVFIVLAVIGVAGGAASLPSFVPAVTHLCLGVLFIYVGALIQERQRLGHAFRDLVESFEAFNQTIYGKDYKVQRQAVEILVGSLFTDDETVKHKVHEQLVRITGQQLPPDAKEWQRWWAANRATFSHQKPGSRPD